MKCPNCKSQMFVIDETANAKSQVTFYRCSICVSEHVSSEPIFEAASNGSGETFAAPATGTKSFVML